MAAMLATLLQLQANKRGDVKVGKDSRRRGRIAKGRSQPYTSTDLLEVNPPWRVCRAFPGSKDA
jgi:hypothetical protein